MPAPPCVPGGIFTPPGERRGQSATVSHPDTTGLPTAFSRSQYSQPLIRLGWFFLLLKLPAITLVQWKVSQLLPLASLGLGAIFGHSSTCSAK
jgi:hypothetical protein